MGRSVGLIQASAERLPFPNASFDTVAVSGLGRAVDVAKVVAFLAFMLVVWGIADKNRARSVPSDGMSAR